MARRRAEHASIHGWLTQVVAWFVIAAMALVLAVSVVLPRLANATPYTILTDSMKPGMPPGTLVVVKPVDVSAIGVGDVITYQLKSGESAVVTHRVVAQGYDATGSPIFHTQGDSNSVRDEEVVMPVQIKGKRWYAVPYVGRVTNVVTHGQREAALTIVVTGLMVYAITMFLGAAKDRRRKPIEEGAPQ